MATLCIEISRSIYHSLALTDCYIHSTARFTRPFKTHRHEIFITEAQASLEPLFVEYAVNVVIVGHVHDYMRTCPMAYSKLRKRNPRGHIHIIQGNGGKAVCAI